MNDIEIAARLEALESTLSIALAYLATTPDKAAVLREIGDALKTKIMQDELANKRDPQHTALLASHINDLFDNAAGFAEIFGRNSQTPTAS